MPDTQSRFAWTVLDQMFWPTIIVLRRRYPTKCFHPHKYECIFHRPTPYVAVTTNSCRISELPVLVEAKAVRTRNNLAPERGQSEKRPAQGDKPTLRKNMRRATETTTLRDRDRLSSNPTPPNPPTVSYKAENCLNRLSTPRHSIATLKIPIFLMVAENLPPLRKLRTQ